MQESQLSNYSAWFGLQTLRSKITLLIAFFIIAFGVITLIVFYENRLTININSKGVDVNAPATITALELIAQVRESQKKLYEYLGNPDNSLLLESDSLWSNHLEPTIQKLAGLRPKFDAVTDQQLIDSMQTDIHAFRQAQRNTMKSFREQMNINIEQKQKDSLNNELNKLLAEKQARQIANNVYHKQVEPIATHLQSLLNRFVKRQQVILDDNFHALETSVQLIDISVLGISLAVAFLGILLGYAVVTNLQKSITQPTRLMKRLALGELPSKIHEPQDEFKAIVQASNQLVETLRKAGNFAVEIGEGNLQSHFEPISDKDILGNSLIQMRERLQTVNEDDRRRSWATEGYALLGDIIRKHNQNVQTLCDQVLTAVVEYVGAIQGGIFVYKETEKERFLEMKACYAYGRKKYHEKKINIYEDYAEALIGQAYLEQEKIYMTHLPHGYTEITSGLGETTPSALLITPLKTTQRIEGIMEIASLHPFEQHEIEFLERVSETIGVAISSVLANMQNVVLLHDTQSQSEIMRRQEQEMRKSIADLQIAQDKMLQLQDDLEEKEANLTALINSTDESLIAIDTNYEVLVINEETRRRYKNTPQSGIDVGVNVLDYLSSLREEWKERYDRAFAGEKFDFIKRSALDGKNTYRHYFVAPLHNREGIITGCSVFSRDISELKNREDTLEKRIMMLQAKLEEYDLVGGHLVLDWVGNFAKISDSFLQQLGYESYELVGKPASTLGEKVARLQKSPYWQGEEIDIITKNGEKVTYMAQRLRRQESLDKQIHYMFFPVVYISPISARDANA